MTTLWIIAVAVQAPLLAACVALAGVRRASTHYLGPMAAAAGVALAALGWRLWWLFWIAVAVEVLLILWHEGRTERPVYAQPQPHGEGDHH